MMFICPGWSTWNAPGLALLAADRPAASEFWITLFPGHDSCCLVFIRGSIDLFGSILVFALLAGFLLVAVLVLFLGGIFIAHGFLVGDLAVG